MNDITTRADIEVLIRKFYANLFEIEEMKVIFKDIVFEAHVPHIIHFWGFVLLDEEGYRTNVFDKHLHLPIKSHQFDIWLAVFSATVNELFVGEKADLAIQRATTLAYTFKSKWQSIKEK
ncbi:MAG: group III truncated hemoglobin [bacterium]|nr:group III truncated hemoglobin [bacterium]